MILELFNKDRIYINLLSYKKKKNELKSYTLMIRNS